MYITLSASPSPGQVDGPPSPEDMRDRLEVALGKLHIRARFRVCDCNFRMRSFGAYLLSDDGGFTLSDIREFGDNVVYAGVSDGLPLLHIVGSVRGGAV